ncbi:FkbM family methyltransferase [Flavobacterium sp. YJ01]|uniref:FkbM family methyltransferase n=1 Tax=unclassified Flavobacterium TaxID=196869 RepID=UPI0023E3A7C3|nr:FkbM family methyltransferase [Flavobacterium sp. YJ01]WET01233.1 FkbM family methyltransferase [Flavobacterium sp. YJ01]
MKLKKKIKNAIKDQILKKGFRFSNVFYFNFLESALYQFLLKNKNINFIQIGANDGKRFDPIYEFIKYNKANVRGFVVEPVSDYFRDLCNNYKEYPNIVPLNYAIHNDLTEATIYKIAKEYESSVPEFALGIASFDPNHHLKTNIPKEFLTEEKVKCLSMLALIEKYDIKDVDLLILDTEGYDYYILKSIDFDKISPSIIHFEHGLNSNTMAIEQFEDLKELFYKKGYQLFVEKGDVIAIKTLLFL